MYGRRAFLRFTGGSTLTMFVGGSPAVAALERMVAHPSVPLRSVVVATIDPATIPAFVTPLLIPPVMPAAGPPLEHDGQPVDIYDISVRQFVQQVLPNGLPATTVWGYGPTGQPDLHHFPSYTIEALRGRPVRVTWRNELVDDDGNFLPHLLPVDPTLHWANPEMLPMSDGTRSTDTRPALDGRTYVPPSEYTDPATQYTWYRGPVPTVAHLHGAMGVGDESDGYTEAWVLPAAGNLPADIAAHGRWYEFFAAKAKDRFDVDWAPGTHVFQYPNLNRSCTQWYHDHSLGMTRLNVYAGPAGFYFVRGGEIDETDIVDRRDGTPAILPGPPPMAGDAAGTRYYEIPIAVQDRSFNVDGSLFYPDTRALFDEVTGPFIPASDLSPVWNPEFFGNTIVVNGATWPYLETEQRRYRLRFLNGCQSRALILDFGAIEGVAVWQIGNDSGLLREAFDVMAISGGRVLLGPAERADVIVDFTAVPAGSWVLGNAGPDEPFGGGEFPPADPATTGRVLEFRVVAAVGDDASTPAEHLVLPPVEPLPEHRRIRRLALVEEMSMHFPDSPAEAALATLQGNPAHAPARATKREWSDRVTETPSVGSCEQWEIFNLTADAHPIHVHEVAFEVVDRQAIQIDDVALTARLDPAAEARGPEPGERGRKDTVLAYPGEVTRLRIEFNTAGQYVWHCHILEHEDNEMMRPLRVGPRQPGQPADLPPHGAG